MGETYSCTFVNCDKVFSKAYELKKHKATHDDPNSVYYCSQCDFFTLQKKNLGIHFAIHTGEKIHRCPDVVDFINSAGSPAREERCEYKTNDPAALTKHRKKVHGYIPPPNRSRPSKFVPAARNPRRPRQTQARKVSRYPGPFQHPTPASCRKPSHAPPMANSSSSDSGYAATSTESPSSEEGFSPLPWQGDVDASRQWMGTNSSTVSVYDSTICTSATMVVPDDEMDLTTLYDPSLHSTWMANYEMGYRMFDVTKMKHLSESLHAVPSAPTSLDMQTGREGCLCPEWMVEAGIEGWNHSVLETRREFHIIEA